MRNSTIACRSRRFLAVLAAGSLALVAACGGGSGSANGKVLDGVGKNPADITGTVRFWGWDTAQQLADLLTPEFRKAYPHITLQFKQIPFPTYSAALRPGLASNSGPDVFELQPGAMTAAYSRFALDLTPLATKVLGSDWKSRLAPIGVSAFYRSGRLSALPVGSQAAGTVIYNKTMLDSYGLTVPKTLTELESMCATLKSHGKYCYAQGAQDEWVNQDVYQAIANDIAPGKFSAAVAGKASWTDPVLVRALTTWKRLFHDGVMQPGAVAQSVNPDTNNLFFKGKTAMVPIGSWGMQFYVKSVLQAQMTAAGISSPKPFTALMANFPSATGKSTPAPLFGDVADGLAVNRKSKNAAAAAAFAQWITLTQRGQTVMTSPLTFVPSLRGVSPALTGLVDPALQTPSYQQLKAQVVSVAEHRAIDYPDLITALGDNLLAVATGQKSPAKAASALQSASKNIQR